VADHVPEQVSFGSSLATNTYTLTLSEDIPDGAIVLVGCWGNTGISSISDSQGNSWRVGVATTHNPGVSGLALSSYICNEASGLVTGETLTVTLSDASLQHSLLVFYVTGRKVVTDVSYENDVDLSDEAPYIYPAGLLGSAVNFSGGSPIGSTTSAPVLGPRWDDWIPASNSGREVFIISFLSVNADQTLSSPVLGDFTEFYSNSVTWNNGSVNLTETLKGHYARVTLPADSDGNGDVGGVNEGEYYQYTFTKTSNDQFFQGYGVGNCFWYTTVKGQRLSGVFNASRSLAHIAWVNGSGELELKTYEIGSGGLFSVDQSLTIEAADAKNPSVVRLPDDRIMVVYEHDDKIKRKVYQRPGGFSSVATIQDPGTAPATVMDKFGRLVLVYWDTDRFYVRVFVRQSNGSYSAGGSGVDMSLTTPKSTAGQLIALPDGSLEFFYEKDDDTLQRVRCRQLKSTGAGTWS
jgi:hypothetical protein